jgi:hypothetical protein
MFSIFLSRRLAFRHSFARTGRAVHAAGRAADPYS